ncbi:MAG: TIGR04423 family type III CRISPR-associated protein [Bacteroidota bacterium]|nr:TIGR04423 family type III CRISPR-associated protein [Bacteroidota bacterium]
MHKRYKTLKEIPPRNYEGYIWYSDKDKPEIVNGSLPKEPEKVFPVEGMLYDKEEKISLMIRHTDELHIDEFDLKRLENDAECKEESYYAHRLGDVSKLKLKQIWQPKKDPVNEDWEYLSMKALVFVGFEK